MNGAFLKSQYTDKPTKSSVGICTTSDHFVKLELLKEQFKLSLIKHVIISSLDLEELFNQSDFNGHPSHKLLLIKHIVNEFIRIKGTYIAKTFSQKEKQNQMRQKLSKLILHHHQ